MWYSENLVYNILVCHHDHLILVYRPSNSTWGIARTWLNNLKVRITHSFRITHSGHSGSSHTLVIQDHTLWNIILRQWQHKLDFNAGVGRLWNFMQNWTLLEVNGQLPKPYHSTDRTKANPTQGHKLATHSYHTPLLPGWCPGQDKTCWLWSYPAA